MSKVKKPSKQQIQREQVAAVHKVLYKQKRLQALSDNLESISVLMNSDPTSPLQSNDIRNPPGSGPSWYIQDTGQLNPDIVQAASLCDQVASLMKEMARDLDDVSIPHGDRANLQTALTQQATVWTLRGSWWRDPNPPANPQALVQQIGTHTDASLNAASKVQRYYKPIDQAEALLP